MLITYPYQGHRGAEFLSQLPQGKIQGTPWRCRQADALETDLGRVHKLSTYLLGLSPWGPAGRSPKKDMGPPACRPAIHRRQAKGRLQCVLGGSQWHKPWQTDSWQTDGLFSAPSGWGKGPDCDLQLCTEQQYLPLLKSMGGLLKSAPPGDPVVYWETSTLMWETTLRPGGV